MRRSLRLRLLVWILALLLPASAAAGWLLVRVFAGRLVRDIDVALAEEAATVAALLEKPGTSDILQALLTHVSSETDLGTGKQIAIRRGATVIAESPPGAAAFLRAHAFARDVRIASHETGSLVDPMRIEIGVPASVAAAAAQRLTLLLAVGIPCSVLLLATGLWIVIGRTLGPLEAASRRVEAIGVSDLTTRLPINNPEDEIGRMVQALNRMLDRVSHAVEQMQRFTADAAHEMRTPLTVLRAGLEVAVSRHRTADEYRAALNDALTATEHLSQLAEDLLALARLDAAIAAPNETAPIDVTELLHDLADSCRTRAAEHDVAVALTCDGPLTVNGHLADLCRLFNNLIENALRHSPNGGVLRLESHASGDWVHISVGDDGPGIAVGEGRKVFDRFYRGGDARGAGAGLGLSIAHAIARAHGGHIDLANRAEDGCVATVSLPRARAPT